MMQAKAALQAGMRKGGPRGPALVKLRKEAQEQSRFVLGSLCNCKTSVRTNIKSANIRFHFAAQLCHVRTDSSRMSVLY